MNEKEIMIDIKKDPVKNFYILISPFGIIEIPWTRISELPTTLRSKFQTQKKISFRILANAINHWLDKGDEMIRKLRELELRIRNKQK